MKRKKPMIVIHIADVMAQSREKIFQINYCFPVMQEWRVGPKRLGSNKIEDEKKRLGWTKAFFPAIKNVFRWNAFFKYNIDSKKLNYKYVSVLLSNSCYKFQILSDLRYSCFSVLYCSSAKFIAINFFVSFKCNSNYRKIYRALSTNAINVSNLKLKHNMIKKFVQLDSKKLENSGYKTMTWANVINRILHLDLMPGEKRKWSHDLKWKKKLGNWEIIRFEWVLLEWRFKA